MVTKTVEKYILKVLVTEWDFERKAFETISFSNKLFIDWFHVIIWKALYSETELILK